MNSRALRYDVAVMGTCSTLPTRVMPDTGMSVSVKSATNADVYFAAAYTRTSVKKPVKYSAAPEFPIVIVPDPDVDADVEPCTVPPMYIVVAVP
jgi:hypothetical protein